MQNRKRMLSNLGTEGPARRLAAMFFGVLAFFFLLAGNAWAQDALRSSLAGEAASRARKSSENIPYNIKAGPVSIRFDTSVNLNYIDNVGVSQGNQLAEIYVAPQARVEAIWPVTPQNTLNTSLGVGYSKGLLGNGKDSLIIQPGSALSFDVFISDFRINVHDRFSYYQDPLQQGAISGGTNSVGGTNAAQYGVAQNAIGISADWDLNKVVLSFGYDHQDSFATSSQFSYIDSSSEYFFIRASSLVSPGLTVGLETTAGLTKQSENVRSDSRQYSAGPFVSWQLSQFLAVSLRGGYVVYSFDPGGVVTNASETASAYASFALDHILNQYLSHSLSAGYQVSQGVNADAITTIFVRHAANWRVVRKTDIHTDIFYENAEETRSTNPESFQRLGASFGVAYQLTQKLSSTLSYSFTKKDSNIAGRDYTANSVNLSLNYRF